MDNRQRVPGDDLLPAVLKEELPESLLLPNLTSLQRTARDLYMRGFNVFPVPSPYEVRAWAAQKADRDPTSKPAYTLRRLFLSRMHVCGPECRRIEERTGHRCLPAGAEFDSLFLGRNIGCMCGRTSGNLIVIDCDSAAAVAAIQGQLDKRNLPYWSYGTSRGTNFMLRVVDGEVRNVPKAKSGIPGLEIWGTSHFVVLPPSIHATGTVYQWTTPEPMNNLPVGATLEAISIQDLVGWLDIDLAIKQGSRWEEPEVYGLPEWTGMLSLNNRRILAGTHPVGTRNTQLTKAVYDIAGLVVQNKVSEDEANDVLEAAARRSNYSVEHARLMLRSAIKSNPSPARADSGINRERTWLVAHQFAQGYNWRVYGRMAQTARTTFLACVERSRRDASKTFRASEREISELANFGDHKRARRALRLLATKTDDGNCPALIVRVSIDQRSGANVYSFSDIVLATKIIPNDPINPPIVVNSGVMGNIGLPGASFEDGDNSGVIRNISASDTVMPGGDNSGVTGNIPARDGLLPGSEAERDVFIRLGSVAWRVWRCLCDRPLKRQTDISCETGLVQGSVSKALQRLIAHGLVVRGEDGLYRGVTKTTDELDRISAVLGSLGRSAQREREHQRERERSVNIELMSRERYWYRRWEEWEEQRKRQSAVQCTSQEPEEPVVDDRNLGYDVA